MKPLDIDWIGIAESAYARTQDERTWLEQILQALRPVLDQGDGLIGYSMKELRLDTTSLPAWAAVALGLSQRGERAKQDAERTAWGTPGLIERYLASPRVGGFRRQLGVAYGALDSILGPHGFAELFFLVAGDQTARHCIVVAPCIRAAVLPRYKRYRLECIAAHLTAAYRLRVQASPTEAILDPAGKVHEASGVAQGRGARQVLRDAVRKSERARGALRRRDADEALAIWRALVAGRWSLVDWFDSDGRRYLVAKQNEPQLASRAALTPRELHVAALAARGCANKVIAYELGLSEGTVTTHLLRAQAKLGACSRLELATILRPLLVQ
jgi:DNA-binding CsgD family transcriptional regulator